MPEHDRRALLDTHVHLWDPAVHNYPWLAGETALHRPFGPADLDPGPYEVDGLVIVEAGCAPEQAGAELAWIESLAAAWPAIRAVVAQAPLERGTGARPVIASLASHDLVAGIRRNAQDEPPGFLTEPDFATGVGMLASFGLTFDACVREHQLRELARLADRCASVTVVLDHLGKPDIRQRRRQPWFDDLASLARRDNVVVKLSGLTTESDPDWRPADLRPYLRHALEAFGPDRCLFGSDWPVATLATTYARWVEVVLDAVADLPAPARAAVLGGTGARVYGLDPARPPDAATP